MDVPDNIRPDVKTVCLMILAAVALGFAIKYLQPVLVPLVLALFFVSGLLPLLNWLENRWSMPRAVSVGVAFLLGTGLAAMLWLIVWISVVSLMKDAPLYQERFGELISNVENSKIGRGTIAFINGSSPPIPDSDNGDGNTDDASANSLPQDKNSEGVKPDNNQNEVANSSAKRPEKQKKPGENLEKFLSKQLGAWISYFSATLQNMFLNGLTVVLLMMFLLIGKSPKLSDDSVWLQIDAQIRNYIVLKSLISFFTGLFVTITLWLFGVPMAAVFGLLAFMLNFIPNLGPILAAVLPVPLIVLDPDLSVMSMVIVIGLNITIQTISGNLVEPKLMGDSFQIHPVTVLVALVFWGLLWGMIGFFLAVPMTAAAKILLERLQSTRPIAYLMAGDFEALQKSRLA
jgi:AI-2 transport protein TqsA